MEKYIDFIKRNLSWALIAAISLLLLIPTVAEYKTYLLIIISESFAIALSGLALYAYTKIDFTDNYLNGKYYENSQVIGQVFLGVHLLVGLVVLGVYIAQFSN